MTATWGELSRREFLASCAALAAAAGVPEWLARAHGSLAASGDEPYSAVLSALVRTVLPFDHPRFPRVAPRDIESRLLALFPLAEPRFASLRQALVTFDELALFPKLRLPPADPDRPATEEIGSDQRAYAEFAAGVMPHGAGRFIELAPASRAEYLRLWGRSASSGKRAFYRSTNRLVMLTAYSDETLWQAIGYAGPLIRTRP